MIEAEKLQTARGIPYFRVKNPHFYISKDLPGASFLAFYSLAYASIIIQQDSFQIPKVALSITVNDMGHLNVR